MISSGLSPALAQRAHAAVREGTAGLLDQQHPEGWWEGRVDCDPSVTAQYLLTARYLDRLDPEIHASMLDYLRRAQLPEGGWPAYPGGPASLDVSLLCYAALKFGGVPAEGPDLTPARLAIRTCGGLEGVGFIPRFALVCWGQVPPDGLIYLSPKLLCVPPAVHPNLRDVGILLQAVVPLELLLKARAVKRPPAGSDLTELRTGGSLRLPATSGAGAVASWVSRIVDALLPARGLDHRAAEWLAERQNADGLWTGMPLFTHRCLMALHVTDADRFSGAVDAGMAGLARMHVRGGAGRWQQLARSPVLDTAIAVASLVSAGVPAGHPHLRHAYDWLIGVQSRRRGDWRWNAPHVEPGGWSFIPENDRNPDIDTTLHVLEALALAPPDTPGAHEAVRRGVRWILGMQNGDGSWGAFTRQPRLRISVVREVELKGAMDYGTADVTARVIRALSSLGAEPGPAWPAIRPAIVRGLRFLTTAQLADGAWEGRWAVNYTYGAAQGLTAFAAGGHGQGTAAARARQFLESTQHADGGWGESPESYAVHRYLPASSTVTQTGMALLALLAATATADAARDPAVAAGITFLLDRRSSDAVVWEEGAFCQTMLPGHLYFQNSLLAPCLAQMVVSRYLRTVGAMPACPPSRGAVAAS